MQLQVDKDHLVFSRAILFSFGRAESGPGHGPPPGSGSGHAPSPTPRTGEILTNGAV